jgi:hypothetical protein
MINTNTDILSKKHPLSLPFSRNWEITKGKMLLWKQPKRLRSEYQLHSQDHLWGSLNYENAHYIHRAIAKTAEEEWIFKYTRFSLPKVTVQMKNDLVAQAIIETNWGWRGTLIFNDGPRYTWQSTDHAQIGSDNEFCFLTPEGHPVVFFRPRTGLFKLEAEVEIDPAVLHNPRIPLLTMLGWFLVLLRLC